MSKYRIPQRKSQYYLSKEDYLTAVHWCLRYPRWKAELEIEADTRKAITYDQDKVQSSGDSDPMFNIAIRIEKLTAKMRLLESTIKAVDADLYEYLLLGVAYGMTEYQLRERGMPCGHNQYYKKRHMIYYEIAKRI